MEPDKSKIIAPILFITAIAAVSWKTLTLSKEKEGKAPSLVGSPRAVLASVVNQTTQFVDWLRPKRPIIKSKPLPTFKGVHTRENDPTAPRNENALSICSETDDTPLLDHKEPSIRLSLNAIVNRGETSKSRQRFISSRTMVQVGALMVRVQPSYTEEILPYRFPVEHKCFVHPDGSRLDIMSEDLAAAESAFTSEAYATQCVEHVAAAAERNKTYFKLRSNTTADTIVTTILDRYVNFHLGPSPVIVMAFMLVENHKAYTIQIQCQSDEYKGRLGDILACAQSARLLTGDLRPAGRGCNVLTYRVDAGPQYKVRIPVDFIVTTPVEGELHLQYRFDSLKTWKGIVTNSQKSPNKDEDEKQCMELPGGKLFLFIYFDVKELSPAIKSEVDHLLASITVTPEETVSSVLHFYESDELCIPLPNLAAYVINVCEHANDTFVTLFMEEGSTGALFEMELHTVVIAEEQMEKFILYVETLFLTAAKPSIVKNASGQDRISTEGMAAIEEEMMLVLDAVRLSGEHWLVVRWTYAGCDPLPRPLEQYRDHLLEGVVANK